MGEIFAERSRPILMLTASLAVLAGLAVYTASMEIDLSPLPVEMVTSTAPATVKTQDAKAPVVDLVLPETLVRPLFSPTRRDYVAPPPPPIASAPPAALPPPLPPPVLIKAPPVPVLKFQGTRIVDGKPSALIAIEDKTSAWLGEGDNIAGWRISSISSDRISLATGSQTTDFWLYETGKGQGNGKIN